MKVWNPERTVVSASFQARPISATALPACGGTGRDIRRAIDALQSIGPVGHRHINFRGTYRVPVERYAERLVQLAG